jgi:hypothetical protein
MSLMQISNDNRTVYENCLVVQHFISSRVVQIPLSQRVLQANISYSKPIGAAVQTLLMKARVSTTILYIESMDGLVLCGVCVRTNATQT